MGLKSVFDQSDQSVIDQQKSNMDQVDQGRGGDGGGWYLFHSMKHSVSIKCWCSGSVMLFGTRIPFS